MIERKNNLNLQYNNTAHSSMICSTKSSKLPVFRSAVSNGQNTSVLKFLLIGIIALVFFSLAAAPVSAAFPTSSGGNGNETDPYIIANPADLQQLATDVNGGIGYSSVYFKVTEDIDLSTVCNSTSGTNWTQIGTSESLPFRGIFDGGNNTISNLYINTPNAAYVGLFGYTSGATIKNLVLRDVNVTGKSNVGGLVGWMEYAGIRNCYATGNVTGYVNVGGLVGQSYSATTDYCYAAVTVTGIGTDGSYIGNIGGLVGLNGGSIDNCYATGTVTAAFLTFSPSGNNAGAGGLTGYNSGSSITKSVALNQFVLATGDNVGRVVGYASSGSITDCYAWEGMTNSGTPFASGGKNGTNASSAQVWNNLSFYNSAPLSWDFTNIWQFNSTNPKYKLPVLKMNPDTTGLDASYMDTININDCTITITNVTYNGMVQSPGISIEYRGEIIAESGNYTVTNTPQTSAGDYQLTITGIGKIAGTITKDWNITAVKEDIPDASPLSFVYNRTAITLPASYDSGNITASNLTFTSAGEYTAEFELKDKTNYTWYDETTANKTIEWNITKAALSADNFTYTAPSNLVYDGTAKTAQVIANDDIYGNGNISITYHNATTNAVQSPVAAGTYNVNISVGDGTNYTTASDLHGDWVFTIEPRVFSEANITFAIEPDTYAFNGTAITPVLNVTDKDTNLKITEFTASGNTTKTAAGEYTITVTGNGNYTAGTITKDWNITKVAPQSKDFTLNPISKEYTGSNLTTTVTSKFGGMGTISNITYNGIENVKDVGTYTVRVNVTGGENYTAASLVEAGTFTITSPAQPKPSGGSTDTGSGNYKEYDRSVTDGGAVSFGTSPIVTEVDLPKGTTGQVALIAESDVPAPEGKKTVKVFEINIPNYPSGKESVVKFKLTLTEIEKAGYTPSDICLYHCDENGVWTKLPTTFTIKDGVVYYEAVTTEFSPFAIVYEENGAAEVSQPAVTPVKTQTAEPVSTYVEPTKTAVPTAEQTKSPAGLVGLGLGLLGAALVLRRK